MNRPVVTPFRSSVDELLARNVPIAAAHQAVHLVPALQAIIITCCDHRVDPAHVLGLEYGECVVIRNAGGRITPEIVETLEVLGIVAMVEALPIEPTIIVMQHTDCGIGRLDTPEFRHVARRYLSANDPSDELNLADPAAAVRADVARLRAAEGIPRSIPIVGFVLDVESGIASKVVVA